MTPKHPQTAEAVVNEWYETMEIVTIATHERANLEALIDDALAEAIAAAEQRGRPRWTPVAEQLPPVHQDVLLCHLSWSNTAVGYLEGDGEWYVYTEAYMGVNGYISPSLVTHWMPMPVHAEAEVRNGHS